MSEGFILDDLDRRLLRMWQAAPDLGMADLADQAGVPALRASRRVARMQAAGVVRGVRGVIDWRALGYEVAVALRVTLDKTAPRAFDEFLDAARQVPEVTEIQTFLGRVDVRLMVVSRDLVRYRSLYRDHLLTLPHIAEIESLMTVSTVKRDEALPL